MPDAARPACPLCRSADATFRRGHRYPGIDFEYRYHRCGACTAEYVWPQPDERALAAIYDDAAY